MAGYQTELEKAYTAGIIDGEGCIRIDRSIVKGKPSFSPRYTLDVRISMTDRQVIEYLGSLWGGSIFERNYTTGFGHKTQWLLTIRTEQARQMLIAIKPYLRVKKEEAETALRLRMGRRGARTTDEEISFRHSLFLKMSVLKG